MFAIRVAILPTAESAKCTAASEATTRRTMATSTTRWAEEEEEAVETTTPWAGPGVVVNITFTDQFLFSCIM